MARYLIIVARERPDLFQQLHEHHGHEMRVIFDRRQVPRTVGPRRGHSPPEVYSQIERDGFMVTLAT